MKVKYRPEIDGLRTIAVVPVILFHAGFEAFSGGFVGVDIFFVISGYLITTILINEHDDGRFSLIKFYERRARRILPALFFVILCCLPFAWLWLLPDDFVDFGKSLIATALFGSNIYFWADSGYFSTANELKPLLHTWSLAVEEQFYIFFPLALMLFWRFGWRFLIGLLILVFVVSLSVSHWAAFHKPDANFYLLPTRAWELLIGSFCAFWLQKRSLPTASPVTHLFGLTGLGLIAYAILFFDGTTPFPSLYALAPTAGTALIILFAGKGTLTGAILSLKPMVGIGLVSYSAYLWHQPIFAFARHRSLLEPSQELMLGLSVLSLILAFLSWKFVEAPFRDKKAVSRSKIFRYSGAGIALSAMLGTYWTTTAGLPFRFGPRLPQIEKISEHIEMSWDQSDFNCLFFEWISPPNAKKPSELNSCLNRNNLIFLIGDSHAHFLHEALETELAAQGFSLVTFAQAGCLPIQGVKGVYFSETENRMCSEFKKEYYDEIMKTDAPIIVASRWRLYLDGSGYDNGEGGVEHRERNGRHEVENPTSLNLAEHITTSLRHLSNNHSIYVVNQIPEAGWHPPRVMIKRLTFNAGIGELSTSYDRYILANNSVFSLMSQLNAFANVIHAEAIVCDTVTRRCANERNGLPLYYDDDHPSPMFANSIAVEIVAQLQNPANNSVIEDN